LQEVARVQKAEAEIKKIEPDVSRAQKSQKAKSELKFYD
jgi:hypothetical protein